MRIKGSTVLNVREKLLRDRYLLPTEQTEMDMYNRVAKFIARGDDAYSFKLYGAMAGGTWLPNTPTLVNAGTGSGGGLSACYVLPIEDSLDGIYKTVWDAARVHKAFGGTGFNFSHIRGKGSLIRSTGGKACGPLKVMHLLNESAGVVSQGGKREGANMGILNSDHPDIHEFIHCKDTDGVLTHFNISVGLYDKDVRDNPELIRTIAEHAWRTGDPGVVFLDRLSEANKYPERGPVECTNPCGEQPLRAYESCNLASINLANFVDCTHRDRGEFMYGRFEDCVKLSVRALNDIIDLNVFPIPEIQEATMLSRKIGSGVMGWADALVLMGISYQSKEAITLIHDIGDVYRNAAVNESQGRNETLLTIAPTGTLSYLARCSWGIEPIYDWEYTRESESGTDLVKSRLYATALQHGIAESSLARNIPYGVQIDHVATWQQYVDNAVSKTINLSSDKTVEDVENVILLAWQRKCKGITVYRDGSKNKQVIRSATKIDINEQRAASPNVSGRASVDYRRPGNRGIERYGSTLDFPTGCGKIHITTNAIDRDNLHPWEVYILTQGGCPANNEALGKVISKYLHDPRLEGDEQRTVAYIVSTLSKVVCPTAVRNPKSAGKSCADIIAKRMREYWIKTEQEQVPETSKCPECGSFLSFGSGCRNGSCITCGWSGCS